MNGDATSILDFISNNKQFLSSKHKTWSKRLCLYIASESNFEKTKYFTFLHSLNLANYSSELNFVFGLLAESGVHVSFVEQHFWKNKRITPASKEKSLPSEAEISTVFNSLPDKKSKLAWALPQCYLK